MAEAPQGLFLYPGVKAVLSASYTLGHGISPSVFALRIAPQFTGVPDVGMVQIVYGGVRLKFPECRIDKVSGDIGDDGKEVWELTIFDRRWKWKNTGKLSGYYNVRDNETGGTSLLKETERTPQQLAELCLRAMGEGGYNVRKMPNVSRPAVEWDYANPADALQQLCDDLGCRVVLGLDNRVRIEVLGKGRQLPAGRGQGVLTDSKTLDPPERPDRLIVAAGHTRLNVDLPLEAIGLDIDGEWKPLDLLSYAPQAARNGTSIPGVSVGKAAWNLCNLPDYNAVKEVKCRELAKQTVYRVYRILPPFYVPLQGAKKGFATKVTSLREILPIEDEQTFKAPKRDPKKDAKNLPAIVYGVWNDGHEATANVTERPDPTKIDAVQSLYPQDKEAARKQKLEGMVTRSFSIDKERGHVIFDEPIVRYYEESGGILRYPAVLFLRTAVCLRHPETLAFHRYERERATKGKKTNTEPRYVVKDELAAFAGAEYTKNYDFKRIHTNEPEVKKYLDYYLDALEREYDLKDPRSLSYAGFKVIDPDGAIQQVTWTLEESGYAKTSASYNREEANTTFGYKERRLYENIQVAIESQKKTGAGKKWEVIGSGVKA